MVKLFAYRKSERTTANLQCFIEFLLKFHICHYLFCKNLKNILFNENPFNMMHYTILSEIKFFYIHKVFFQNF